MRSLKMHYAIHHNQNSSSRFIYYLIEREVQTVYIKHKIYVSTADDFRWQIPINISMTCL